MSTDLFTFKQLILVNLAYMLISKFLTYKVTVGNVAWFAFLYYISGSSFCSLLKTT